MMKYFRGLLFLLFACATLLAAIQEQASPDISGVWNFTVETAAGSGNPTITFKQDGKNLIGTYKGLLGTADIQGTVEGSDVKFSFRVDFQGQQLEVTYVGKIDGKDSMKGTVRLGDFAEGTWTAKKQE